MRAEAEILLDRAEAGGESVYPDPARDRRHGEALARVFRAVGLAEGETRRST